MADDLIFAVLRDHHDSVQIKVTEPGPPQIHTRTCAREKALNASTPCWPNNNAAKLDICGCLLIPLETDTVAVLADTPLESTLQVKGERLACQATHTTT